jgi:multimeric flavodoxin WrbA
VSCFSCKIKDGKSYGKCAVKDGLTPILAQVEEANAIILGSPIYLGTVTGEMRSFMERLIFPYLTYTDPPDSLFPKKINTGFIYTMNIPEELKEIYSQHFLFNEILLSRIFGGTEALFSFDTYQFEDYTKVVADRFNHEQKAQRRRDIFPGDCEKAFNMGARLVKE